MLDPHDARRPAQVNACFEGGAGRREEIVAALRQAGLAEDQITVIDRPGPESETPPVKVAGPGFLDRIMELFGGDDDKEREQLDYDLLILAHLGDDERLAGPVQETLQRLGAARVSYYPPAEAEMHVLGGAGPSPVIEESPPGSSGTATSESSSMSRASERADTSGTTTGATGATGGDASATVVDTTRTPGTGDDATRGSSRP